MKTLNRLIIILIILLFLVGTFLITAKTNNVKDHYTYTKAICDGNNFCQDHIITCEEKEVVDIKPITGAFIQLPENWEDARENKSEILCE